MMNRRTFLKGAALAPLASSLQARAQDAFPNRAIKIIVPAGTGLAVDACARYIANKLAAMLYAKAGLDMEAPERTTIDFRTVPHIFGVPRYLYRKALSSVLAWLTAALRGDSMTSFDHELWVWFFAGIVRQRWMEPR